jgi:hypothetical protein
MLSVARDTVPSEYKDAMVPEMPGSDLDLPPEIDMSRPHPARI